MSLQLQMLLEMIPESQIDNLVARLPPRAAAVLTGQVPVTLKPVSVLSTTTALGTGPLAAWVW